MSATTTALFTNLGLSWSDIYSAVSSMVGTSIHAILDILVALWPLWVVLGILGVALSIPFIFLSFLRRKG